METGFRLGHWIVWPQRDLIDGPDETVHIKPKSMAVLECLARAQGDVVSRNDILDAVWPGADVTDDVLAHSVTELRKAFGDSQQDPGVIETIPKKGLRLMLEVAWLDDTEGLALEKAVDPDESISHVTGRRMNCIVISLLCVAILVFAYDKWWLGELSIASIAVLPLENLSADPGQAYFTEGMTDVLTSELGQIGSLRVISRTSADLYKDSGKSLSQIARELDVDALIEGSVQRSEDEVRITLQLIDGRTDRHLWSRSFQRELGDVLTLQGEVARAIAHEIQQTVTPEVEARLARDRAADPEAVRLWVVGNHHMKRWDRDLLYKALQAFQEAAKRDPDFAPSYAGIAQAYVAIGSWHTEESPDRVLAPAKTAAQMALRLDPYLAEVHLALGMINWLEWDWEAAVRDFQRSRELNPSDASGLLWYTNFLGALGRHEEAIEVGMEAVKLDPLSPATYNELASALWLAGRNDEAEDQFNKALELDPDFWQTIHRSALFYAYSDQHGKALSRLEKRLSEYYYGPIDIGFLAHCYAQIGRADRAQQLLAELQATTEPAKGRAFGLAVAHLAVGNVQEALDWLEVAYDERDITLIWIKEYPAFDALREDARFQSLVNRMNFPD